MEYIIDQITYPLYSSRAFQLYFQDMKLGVLDIETTGLNPRRNQFVLGGLLTIEDNQLKVEQFFAEEPQQEQETLQAFLSAVEKTDFLLTYNGRHFDIPFIKSRAQGAAEYLPFNLDLYLAVRSHSPIRKFLPNLKQKTVENFMGLWDSRKDEISGKESVDLYYQYVAEKSPSVKQRILLHNHDDVLQLYRLLAVLEKVDLHKALHHMGFPILAPDPGLPGLIIEKLSVSGNQFQIAGIQNKNAAEYLCYEWEDIPCSARFSKSERRFSVTIPVIRQSGLVFIDLKSLKMDLKPFEKYPSCQEGFLILEADGEKNYMEINHFVKRFLERMLKEWITRS